MSLTINLPWPSPVLSPNSRPHWAKRAAAVKTARKTAWAATLETGVLKLSAPIPIHVTTTFFPPDRRSYDQDGLQARAKAYFDGISDAIGVDDKHFRHGPVEIGQPVKGGSVRIEISEAV